MAMQFLSDNAASVHPALWRAMQAADAPDSPYDGDALSQRLDAAFSEVFGRDCAVLWAATGTSANCLALASFKFLDCGCSANCVLLSDPHGTLNKL